MLMTFTVNRITKSLASIWPTPYCEQFFILSVILEIANSHNGQLSRSRFNIFYLYQNTL